MSSDVEVVEEPCVFEEGEVVLCRDPDFSRPRLLHKATIISVPDDDNETNQKYVVHFEQDIFEWNRAVSRLYLLKDNDDNRSYQKMLAKKYEEKLEREKKDIRDFMTRRRPPVGKTRCKICTCFGGRGPCNPHSKELKRERLQYVCAGIDSSDSASSSDSDHSRDPTNQYFYKVLKVDRKHNKISKAKKQARMMKKKNLRQKTFNEIKIVNTRYILKLVTAHNISMEKIELDEPKALWIYQNRDTMNIFDMQRIINTHGSIQSLIISKEMEKPMPTEAADAEDAEDTADAEDAEDAADVSSTSSAVLNDTAKSETAEPENVEDSEPNITIPITLNMHVNLITTPLP